MRTAVAALTVLVVVASSASSAVAQYGHHHSGYRLYFDGRLVSGPDADHYTRGQARQNCMWNADTKPNIAITCTYNGVVFFQRD